MDIKKRIFVYGLLLYMDCRSTSWEIAEMAETAEIMETAENDQLLRHKALHCLIILT